MNNKDMTHDMDEREIDMMLKYVPQYSDSNESNIKNKFAQRAKAQKKALSFKKITLAAAVAIMVFVTAITALAYADVIDLGKIYTAVFGENSEYLEQYIEPLEDFAEMTPVAAHADYNNEEDASLTELPPLLPIEGTLLCEYDGIVIRLISAINDEHVLHIFAAVTDITGDRLDESLEFPDWWLSQGYGGNISVIDYNAESKKATIMITSLGDHQQGIATLMINSIATGRKFLYDLPEINIAIGELLNGHSPSIISQSEVWKDGGGGDLTLYETSRLLRADELDIPFDNDARFSISNIGFVDGVLHIQTKASSGGGAFDDGYFINLKLIKSGGETAYDADARIDFVGREHAYAENRAEPYDKFSDFIFEGITNHKQLIGLGVAIDIMNPPETIEGSWEFATPIGGKITTDLYSVDDLIINGGVVSHWVSISPLGVSVHLPENISSEYTHSDTVLVEYNDGTIIELSQSSIHGYESESTLVFGGQIIEVENVQWIIINGEKINVMQQ